MGQVRNGVSEATELACLLGYIAELSRMALGEFTKEDITAEEALERALVEFHSLLRTSETR